METFKTASQFIPNMDLMGWLLLFCGWTLYWLKTLNQSRIDSKGQPYMPTFLKNNAIEIPTSIISCFVLAILGNDIPSELLDMHGRISTLMIGYASSSILNGLITMSKKQ